MRAGPRKLSDAFDKKIRCEAHPDRATRMIAVAAAVIRDRIMTYSFY
jgi:hypothetical protein